MIDPPYPILGVIRGLATGAVNDHNLKETLLRELQMGLALSVLLGAAGAARAAIFMTPFTETLAVTTSLTAIVFISVLLGAVLPVLMKCCQIDPGASRLVFACCSSVEWCRTHMFNRLREIVHSSTTIQVIMDILGVSITVCTLWPKIFCLCRLYAYPLTARLSFCGIQDISAIILGSTA